MRCLFCRRHILLFQKVSKASSKIKVHEDCMIEYEKGRTLEKMKERRNELQ